MAEYRRFAGPAALLLAVTIAVVLIRVFAEHHHHTSSSTGDLTGGITVILKKKYWTVKAGDTLPKISAKSGIPLATIRRLNPHVSATSLYIGEKLRLR
ncbi:MAG TPA: LysM domain-containing protein [Gaiellaceae bacterium]|nr:LysM domain-containing protein [Gaiellaceae bacterium]